MTAYIPVAVVALAITALLVISTLLERVTFVARVLDWMLPLPDYSRVYGDLERSADERGQR
jgi:hypothetical protein